jgi:hypothetical protein
MVTLISTNFWDSSVDTATGWMARVRFPTVQDCLFSAASRPALGPNQPLNQWTMGTFFQGVMRPGREADHSHASSAKPPLPPMSS